ncbi:MAG TPA: hypothetical protein VNX17_06200 [Edaphobacter sp.]|nr:hypothetical protein [Edaphobacter sp.]
MFGSVILDVAIGMAFVYLLLSLIASVIQEMLAAFMQLRAANLERGLRSLFSGDSFRSEMDLVDCIYDHGLVRGLYSDPLKDSNKIQSRFRKMMDGVRQLARRLIGISPDKPLTIQANPLLLPSYIPSRTFALALIDVLNADKEQGYRAMSSITKALAEHDNKAAQALLTLAIDARGDVVAFQRNLEEWYNDAMDRVSGWYKRYTQRVLVVIGLLLAVAFNVNSVRVARTLWLDRDARQAMVDAAGNYAKDHPAATNQAAPADTGKLREQLQSNVDVFSQVTTSALLPLGWKHPWHFYEDYFRVAPKDAIFAALTIVAGWVMTALAISFGAPFWFDTLNKFMVVRSTVKPQEKSKTETAKG